MLPEWLFQWPLKQYTDEADDDYDAKSEERGSYNELSDFKRSAHNLQSTQRRSSLAGSSRQ